MLATSSRALPGLLAAKRKLRAEENDVTLTYLKDSDRKSAKGLYLQERYNASPNGPMALPPLGQHEGLLAKYLDRPELINELIKAAQVEATPNPNPHIKKKPKRRGPLYNKNNRKTGGGMDAMEGPAPASDNTTMIGTLASRYRVVSPRTQRLIGMLPRPNAEDLKKIDAIQETVKKKPLGVEARTGLYHLLHRTNRVSTETEEQADMADDLLALEPDLLNNIMTTTTSTGNKRITSTQGDGPLSPTRSKAATTPSLHLEGMMIPPAYGPSPPETPLGGETETYPKFKMGHTTHVQDRIITLKKLLGQLEETQKNSEEAAKALVATIREEEEGAQRRKLQKKLLGQMVSNFYQLYLRKTIKAAWKLWKGYADWLKFVQQSKAAVVVQKYVRRWLARRHVAMMRKMVKKKLQREGDTLVRVMLRRASSALEIQRIIRGYQCRKRLHDARARQEGAALIQRNWRVTSEWRKNTFLRLVTGKRDRAVVTIQCSWRCFVSRRKLRVLRKIKAVQGKRDIRKLWEKRKMEDFRRMGAVITIQRFWRKILKGRRLKMLDRIIKNRKATIIQKYYRRHRAQKLRKRLQMERDERANKVADAVILIQRQIRMYLAKCVYDDMLFEKEKHKMVRTLEKKAAFQSRYRDLIVVKLDTWRQKAFVHDAIHFFDPTWYMVQDRAAIQIQHVYRGHRARRRCLLIREMNAFKRVKETVERKKKAATDVQRVFRGRRGRQVALDLKKGEKAILIQTIWRGYAVRKWYRRSRCDNGAATIIQKFVRAWLARRLFQAEIGEFRRLSKTATTIATFVRGVLARRHFAKRLEYERRVLERRNAALLIQSLRFQMVANRLMLESLYEGYNYTVKYGKEMFMGEGRCLFQHFTQNKEEEKLENYGFMLLLRQSPGVFGGKKLTETDADLIFARLKQPGTKHINYQSFVESLEQISLSLYPDVKRFCYARGMKARILKLVFENLLAGPWAKPYKDLMDCRVRAWMDHRWTRVQALIRGWLIRIKYKKWLIEWEEERRQAVQIKAAIRIQAMARRVLGRLAGIRAAQKAYIKYIDPENNLPYWYEPRSKRSVWNKPKIFGQYHDVERAKKLPPKCTEFLVMCVNCDRTMSECFCGSCEEAFCHECFDGIHLKGHKRKHIKELIKKCPECNYQLATKQCKQCSFQEGTSIHYCDTCFFNVHEGNDKLSRHTFEPLVMNCIECERYAARWRCLDCHDLYCTGCFSKIHARGKRIEHEYESLRYYTPSMHRSYEYDMGVKEKHQEMAQHMMTVTRVRQDNRIRKAVTIQRYWRGYKGRQAGRAVLHAGRRKMRAMHRLRKADDILRNEKPYWYLDQIGMAPILDSDTTEEKVLKRFARFRRASIAARIAKNVEFAPGQVKDKKKVPKRGFGYGTVEELLEQARYGGIRLPGYYTVAQGERIVKSTTDLTKVLNKKSRVRIQDRHFSIDPKKGVTEDKIYLRRLWRRPTVNQAIMYRMPDLSFIGRILYDMWLGFATSNPTQVLIEKQANVEMRVVVILERVMQFLKSKGLHNLGDFCRRRAEVHRERRKQTFLLLNRYQDKYGQDEPEEEPEHEPMNATSLAEMQKKKLEDSYIKKEESLWEDAGKDERTGKRLWKNKETGEVTSDDPLGGMSAEDMTVAQKNLLEAKAKIANKKGSMKRRGGQVMR